MPGTYIFKPVEANLTHNTDLIGKMNPYCTFVVGGTKIKSQVCKKGGKHPHWNDTIIIPIADDSLYPQITVQLMDKERLLSDDNIGDFTLDLQEVQANGQLSKWYPISYDNKPAGEILMEASFQAFPNGLDVKGKIEKEEAITEEVIEQEPLTTFTEQRQVVEPHTFLKEVEVVETRPGIKQIEVMEPVKVIKQVPVTEPVIVRKMVEVTEPEVVVKEVEVMEPRLVTKTIQVVEDVPVIRQVEVVEMKTTFQEVETIESKTYNRDVEVIEYVPVKKEVEVTEPVTVKRAVEFVEPVILTKTVTKAIPQPVVVNEEIDVSVGPATVLDARGEKLVESSLMKEEVLGLEKREELEPVVVEKEVKVIEEEIVKKETMIIKTVETIENGEIEKTVEGIIVEEVTTDSI